jgi:hypothetical protein
VEVNRREFMATAAAIAVQSASPKLPFALATRPKVKLDTSSDPMVPDWSFFIKTQTSKQTLIYCVTGQLDATLVDPNSDLTVFAQDLTIVGPLTLPGKNVTIHAKTISVNNYEVIDVAGLYVNTTIPPPRQDGVNLGESGKPGTPGDAGMDGGSVSIFADSIISGDGGIMIRAYGGTGGRGGDGGNGMKGSLGGPGADAPCGSGPYINKPVVVGGRGASGGTGGNAAPGGQGGPGGNGGQVTVWTIQPLHATPILSSQVDANAKPGHPGPNGADGKEGPGGDGGLGGKDSIFPGPFDCVHPDPNFERGPDGFEGQWGTPAQTNPPATDGTVGTVDIQQKALEDIAKTADVSHLQLLLHHATVDYLSGTYDSAVNTLTWINQLTTQQPFADWPPVDKSEWTNINAVSGALLSQLSAGLDFYGYPLNFVPLVALNAFDKPITDMLATTGVIETQYNAYVQSQAHQDAKIAATKAAINAANDALTQANSDLATISQQENDIQDNLEQLAESLQTQQLAIQQSENAFQQAVQDASGCTFLGVLQCMASLVTIATNAFGDVNSIISSVKGLAGVSNLTGLVKDLTTTAGTIADLQKKTDSFKDALNTNTSKLVITQDNLNKLLSQFSGLAEAATLKAQINTFSQTCLTRSQKALDLTGAEVQRVALMNKISATQSDIVRLKGLLASEADPTLPQYVIFLGKLLADTKQNLVHASLSRVSSLSILGIAGSSIHYCQLRHSRFTEPP